MSVQCMNCWHEFIPEEEDVKVERGAKILQADAERKF